MKICIAGPGAIGIFLASKLSVHNQVYLLHHDKMKSEALAATGFIVKVDGLPTQFSFPITHIAPENCDLLIIAFKSYGFANCTESLKACKPQAVLSIQNGLGNCEKLAEIFPEAIIYAGCTTYGVARESSKSIELKGLGEIKVGGFQGEHANYIVEVLQDSGLNANCYSDIKRQLWLKVGVNACINTVASIFNCENGALLSYDKAQDIWKKVASEISLAASFEGINISPYEIVASATHTATITSENICSMLQDVRAKRKTEIDSICGEISHRLLKHGISATTCTYLNKQIDKLGAK